MQRIYYRVGEELRICEIPNADAEVLEGVVWGTPYELFTPAYWKMQIIERLEKGHNYNTRLGGNLLEETAACILGGYGIPAELGLVAFERLKSEGVLDGNASEDSIYIHLSKEFIINNRIRKYRFARQKSFRLASALLQLKNVALPSGDVDARDLLCSFPGLGPKTASWVIRNYRDSNEVAILDIHILRAGDYIKLFRSSEFSARNYRVFEKKFLDFCSKIEVPAGQLDALIWDQIRRYGFHRQSRLNGRAMQQELIF